MNDLRNLLTARAQLTAKIREYFHNAGVIEVMTPALSFAGNTDPAIESFVCSSPKDTGTQTPMYLHTSPEFFMKRLLCDNSGSIYQLCQVYRYEEQGRWHNPEFVMLEWYRVGYDYQQLMQDVLSLLEFVTAEKLAALFISYTDLFKEWSINPHLASASELHKLAADLGLDINNPDGLDRNQWLDLLMVEVLEPRLPSNQPVFIYDYPASQASLAKLRTENGYQVAERFELYWQGVELANGFTELTDAKEQRRRFEKDNVQRQQRGQQMVKIDDNFLQALDKGMPACSGVALGIERLMLLWLNKTSLQEVMPFSFDRV